MTYLQTFKWKKKWLSLQFIFIKRQKHDNHPVTYVINLEIMFTRMESVEWEWNKQVDKEKVIRWIDFQNFQTHVFVLMSSSLSGPLKFYSWCWILIILVNGVTTDSLKAALVKANVMKRSHHGSVSISVSYCSIPSHNQLEVDWLQVYIVVQLSNPLPSPTSLTLRGRQTHAPHLSNLGHWENERSYFTELYLFSYQFIGFLFSTIFFL